MFEHVTFPNKLICLFKGGQEDIEKQSNNFVFVHILELFRPYRELNMRSRQLVLVPCPFQGHINPMLQLASTLHSKGFTITIIHTQFNSPDPFNHPDFSFQSIPDGLSDRETSSGDYSALLRIVNANCGTPLEERLVRMFKRLGSKDELACVIFDELMYFSETVTRRLQVPSIIFRTNNAATFLARARVLQLIAEDCLPLPDTVLQDMVPDHYPLRFKDLPTPGFGTLENFSIIVNNTRNIRSSSAMIWNTTSLLEMSPLSQLQQQSHIPIFPIGPMHKFAPAISNSILKEDTSCVSWLNKQSPNSVIYVSLGSLAFMSEHDLVEMAWGLANSKQNFLWVIRPGSICGSKWIESLPQDFKEAVKERGHIVKWAPQKQVLAHWAVGGFWTHCGWNSTMESICEGVPMICRPVFGDQRVTARYVSEVWKVGLQLENGLDRDEVERAIRRLMDGKEGEEIRKRAIRLKEKIEICTKKGGSSYNAVHDLVELLMST